MCIVGLLRHSVERNQGEIMTARYTLHGLFASGPTYKVGLMLTLCGEAFDYVSVNLRAGEHKTPEYLAINRFGQVPALVDHSNGRALCQSGAILDYLADKTGKFGGATLDDRLRAREWLFWGWDKLDAPVYRLRGWKLGYRQLEAPQVAMYEAERKAAFETLEAWFAAGHDWLAGAEPTIADIDIYGVVAYAGQSEYDVAQHPHVQAWMHRMQALPHFAAHDALLPHETRRAS
jgi:glutathione S-transferase